MSTLIKPSGRTALTASLLLIGCASTPDEIDDSHVEFSSDAYTLQPGEEKYFCYTTNLPDRDIAITSFTPTYGPGTHHILLAQTLAPEPVGFSECPVLFRSTWLPLYAGGISSGTLALPPNTGFKPKPEENP